MTTRPTTERIEEIREKATTEEARLGRVCHCLGAGEALDLLAEIDALRDEHVTTLSGVRDLVKAERAATEAFITASVGESPAAFDRMNAARKVAASRTDAALADDAAEPGMEVE